MHTVDLMLGVGAEPRHPDDILRDIEAVVPRANRDDMQRLLWDVLADVVDSFDKAMSDLPEKIAEGVTQTVMDYLSTFYGDD